MASSTLNYQGLSGSNAAKGHGICIVFLGRSLNSHSNLFPPNITQQSASCFFKYTRLEHILTSSHQFIIHQPKQGFAFTCFCTALSPGLLSCLEGGAQGLVGLVHSRNHQALCCGLPVSPFLSAKERVPCDKAGTCVWQTF